MWFLLDTLAVAGTLTVGPTGDHTTLQGALDAAQQGDVIELADGEYVTSVSVRVPLTLRGASRSGTIVTSDGTGSALRIHLARDVVVQDLTLAASALEQALTVHESSAILQSVTIQGHPDSDGVSSPVAVRLSEATFRDASFTGLGGSSQEGGLLRITDSVVQVEDSTFVDGVALKDGGAITAYGSDLVLLRSTFSGNVALNGGAVKHVGGWGDLLRVEDCLFEGNGAEQGGSPFDGYGGAIETFVNRTEIRRSVFRGNEADNAGGAIDLSNSLDALVQDCQFEDNHSAFRGGAMSLTRPDGLQVRRNVFAGNTAEGLGGALYLGGAGTFDLHGNVICTSTGETGGAVGVSGWDGVLEGVLRNNLLSANQATDGVSALAVIGPSVLTAENNTIHGGQGTSGWLRADESSSAVLTNNAIVANVGTERALPGDVTGSHNLWWSNDDEVPAELVGEVVQANPGFAEGPSPCDLDVQPRPGSPLVDAGSEALSDVDGTRSDIGTYGGPGANVFDLDGDGAYEEDCAPLDPQLVTASEEIVADGMDQDCDGLDLCYVDADGDGVGSEATAPGDCDGPGLAAVSGDCDDARPELTTDCTVGGGPAGKAPRTWFCGTTDPGGVALGWLVLLGLLRRRRVAVA